MLPKCLWPSFSIPGILAFTLCGSVFASELNVTVYGGPQCSVSKQLMSELGSRQIPYQYVDISTSSGHREMQLRIFESGMLNQSLQTPVVDVNGHFVASESFISLEQVLARLDVSPVSSEGYNRGLVAEIYSEQGDEITQMLIAALERRGLSYEFHDLRNREDNLEWQERLREKGMRPSSIPTTFINGEAFVGLDSPKVLNAYR